MPDTNTFVLAMLREELSEIADPVSQLNRWWASEGDPDESILEFLVRQQVLHPDSRQTLRMARRGFIEMTSDMLVLAHSRGTLVEKLRHVHKPDVPTVETQALDTGRIALPPPTLPPLAGIESERLDETGRADIEGYVDVHSATAPGTVRAFPPGPLPRKDTLRPGTKLGKCMLLGVIGQGGNGTVYRAFHQSLRISVAVKVVRTREGDDEAAFRQRIIEEGRMLAQLNHPNIVRVWDVEEDPVQPWLVLELIEGVTLKDLIEQSGRVDPLRAVKIVREMASALAAAWEIGIVHRDVKPANILIPNTGPSRLADLGLARIVSPGPLDALQNNTSNIAGTVAYMAPEQVENSDGADHRSDMYSLGATFYHAITGELPFKGRTLVEVICKHAAAPLVPAHEKVPGLPTAFHPLISKMMAKKRPDRHQNFADLIADLTRLENDLVPPATDTGTPGAVNRGLLRRLFGR